MKIVISPAKKMNNSNDLIGWDSTPSLIKHTHKILTVLKTMHQGALKTLWGCNQSIADLNYERIQNMDLENNLTPALLAYKGIQFQYMAPEVFTDLQWSYVSDHLRILSGFYGVLHPLDGITPYRLEMQARLELDGARNLYEFWKDRIYTELIKETDTILNLASKEYSRTVELYLGTGIRFVSCIFGELSDGRIKIKATQVKSARGEMVSWIAENQIMEVKDIPCFEGLGYHYSKLLSTEDELVFLQERAGSSD